jgi:tRNA threonylcarbamoyladenosine biosynthesis protein TsaB
MLLLAVDTSTRAGSVALLDGPSLLGVVRLEAEQGHSTTLLPAVQSLLAQNGRQPKDVEFWAVAVGPGAFTGLRVGISSVQGLALASKRPCVPVGTLRAMAAQVEGGGPVVAVLDAFRQEVYVQAFEGAARPQGTPRAGPLADVLSGLPKGAAYVGEAAAAGREAILRHDPEARFPETSPFLAGHVARLAREEALLGQTLAADALRPLYLREAEIRKPKTA